MASLFSGASITMSGPIVRKYGFPNFEKIFGERPIQHGADESAESEDETEPASDQKENTGGKSEKKRSRTKKKTP
jgi:hypothetical protein